MARKYLLSVCLSGVMLLPASLAYACHLHRISMELSCTQYRFTASGGLSPHGHTVQYSFVVTPTAGGTPRTFSKTIPVGPPTGLFEEVSAETINLVGDYDAKSLVGTASLVAEDGRVEHTLDIKLPPEMTKLSCAPRAGS